MCSERRVGGRGARVRWSQEVVVDGRHVLTLRIRRLVGSGFVGCGDGVVEFPGENRM